MTATLDRIQPLDRFESQATFRLLLETASRPGAVRRLPVPGLGATVVPLTLADVETTVAASGDQSVLPLIVRATGAAPVALEEAQLVACRGRAEAGVISRLRRGSAFSPELGAKVGIDCRRLHAGRAGEVTLTLRGPGVDGTATLGVDGIGPDVFDAIAAANGEFLAGIDVWLIDEDDQVAGLPRSCRWTVR